MNMDDKEPERLQQLVGLSEAQLFINLTNKCECGCGFANGEMSSALDLIDRLAAELEKAREVIDKLPKTADGVPVGQGVAVYFEDEGEVVKGIIKCVKGKGDKRMFHFAKPLPKSPKWGAMMLTNAAPVNQCYSTREAAALASKGVK